MRHYQRKIPLLADDPLHDPGRVAVARAGIHQQRPLAPEDQIQERLLIVGAPRLAEYIEGRVVLMHLPVQHFEAARTAGDPGCRQSPRLNRHLPPGGGDDQN
jgi:hypothetical protein